MFHGECTDNALRSSSSFQFLVKMSVQVILVEMVPHVLMETLVLHVFVQLENLVTDVSVSLCVCVWLALSLETSIVSLFFDYISQQA